MKLYQRQIQFSGTTMEDADIYIARPGLISHERFPNSGEFVIERR